MITFRYISRGMLFSLFGALLALSTLFLIIDFADRAKIYQGQGWLLAVGELYLCKLALVAYQFLPAALALGGAVAMSGLRKTGEVTALRALGRGPATFLLPVGAIAIVAATAFALLEDPIVVPANYRSEEITVMKFGRWGDWALYHRNRRWFRGENGRVFYLGDTHGEGFKNVAIYDLSRDFRLVRRLDAKRMEPLPDGSWRLVDTALRTFPENAPMQEERAPERVERFVEDVGQFRVKTGRPSQLLRGELPQQIALRDKLGLPSRELQVSLHERRAYQFTGVPAAILGAALALRRGRRGHLTAAIAEGVGVTVGLWALNALGRTLALGGHLHPVVGGYLPLAAAALAAVVCVRRAR